MTEGERLKAEGMAKAAINRASALSAARALAKSIGHRDRYVTADDVHHCLFDYQKEDLGNAAGSIFRGPTWKFTGRWLKSTRASNHARMIRVWEYVPYAGREI